MEICDSCGNIIEREYSIRGSGNVDDGYFCEKCQEEIDNQLVFWFFLRKRRQWIKIDTFKYLLTIII